MALNIYIGRQPIVTHDKLTYGYELLFRSPGEEGGRQANFNDSMLATTRVVVNTLNHVGILELVGDHLAFINIDKELLMDDIILSIPKERFVLELLEDIVVDDEVIARVKELKSIGYTLVLDDAHCQKSFLDNFLPIFPYMDIVKLDVKIIDREQFLASREQFGSFDFKLLAEKVETEEEYQFFKDAGCHFFQGYFFARPEIVVKESLDPAYKSIFKLINLLGRDSSMDVLSAEFEANPSITLQLLRFMNSGHLQLKAKIRSIVHAITLLGKEPLKHWLLLIAFAKSEDNSFGDPFSSPLMALAQSRSKLMSELMKKLSKDKSDYHEAALVGTLSLIDVITKTSMQTVLGALEMDDSIVKALLTHEGELGMMLKLALATEAFDIESANTIIRDLKLSHDALEGALIQSYKL